MNRYIAYCGLNCEMCEARLATINNDDALRAKVAKLWSELNDVEITPDMINCEGCRIGVVKTPYHDDRRDGNLRELRGGQNLRKGRHDSRQQRGGPAESGNIR